MKRVDLLEKQRKERVGVKRKNNQGSLMEVIAYTSATNITVKFPQGNTVGTNWQNFMRGGVLNVYDKVAYGVGYEGVGVYKKTQEGKQTHCYRTWHHMLGRCYSETYLENNPTYRDCEVDEQWHNFQNFAKWYEANYYSCANERMTLDKDVLCKGRKLYGPHTCVFVPERINNLVLKSDATRGNLPVGVSYDLSRDKYVAKYRREGKTINIGRFGTVNEAFNAYKYHKEAYIREVAEHYKDHIPTKLYQALINYEIEITD